MLPTKAAQLASTKVRKMSVARSQKWKKMLSVAELRIMRYRVFHNEM